MEHVSKCYIIDGEEICKTCGSPKVLNVAFVGALCASGEMDLTLEDAQRAIRARMKPQLLDMNYKALELGAAAIMQPGK